MTPPRLQTTTFPDALVDDAVRQLRSVAAWLEHAAADDVASADGLLDWTGPLRRQQDRDMAADGRAAAALVEALRQRATALEHAADDAADLRAARLRTYRTAYDAWRESLEVS